MSNLKKYVLYFAVKQINDHTDITVNHKQQKESDTLDISAPLKMNGKQRGAFAAKLAQMSELSDRAK